MQRTFAPWLALLLTVFLAWPMHALAVKTKDVKLPPDFMQFIADFDKALEGDDLEHVMSYYSPRFKANGQDFDDRKQWISSFLAAMDMHETTVTGFRRISDTVVEIDATAEHTFGSTPFTRKAGLEDGKWKWLGD